MRIWSFSPVGTENAQFAGSPEPGSAVFEAPFFFSAMVQQIYCNLTGLSIILNKTIILLVKSFIPGAILGAIFVSR
jgi:hypothetical protein